MELLGSVVVFRPERVPDPYRHGPGPGTVPGGWESAAKRRLDGAAIVEEQVEEQTADGRVGVVKKVTLFVDDPSADVRKGDGIARSLTAVVPDFVIGVVPLQHVNPFTGWVAPMEIPMKEAHG